MIERGGGMDNFARKVRKKEELLIDQRSASNRFLIDSHNISV